MMRLNQLVNFSRRLVVQFARVSKLALQRADLGARRLRSDAQIFR